MRKLSAILRVADGLDFGRQAKVEKIECRAKREVACHPSGRQRAIFAMRCVRLQTRSELMNEVYSLETKFE